MIGILAGMGPKSTAPFIDKVVDKCQEMYGAKFDMDFPHMMIYSCPTPFYVDRPIDHAEMEKAIINGAQRLERTGVDFIAMPCNTAHLYYEKIQDSLTVPLLNMVEETIKRLPKNAKKAALLATNPTVQSGLYQRFLSHYGIEYISKDHWQDVVDQLISNIKSGDMKHALEIWENFYSEIIQSVDTAIIACTDLNMITDQNRGEIHFLDSSTCLAEAVVDYYLNGKENH